MIKTRLKTRLSELCEAFEKSAYPKKMLENISAKVLDMERILTPLEPTISEEAKPIRSLWSHALELMRNW